MQEKFHYDAEYRFKCNNGGYCYINDRGFFLFDENDKAHCMLGTMQDITERKRMEEEIRALSLNDQLTGLYNRRGFFTLAEQQLKVASRLQSMMLLIFADLDGMKWINDNLGHSSGDQALIETANILREVFRKSDIVARIGGDEFVILAFGADDTTSVILLNRLQKMVHALNTQENRLFKLYISTGLATYNPESPCSTEELLAMADQSMYKHKQGKRGLSA